MRAGLWLLCCIWAALGVAGKETPYANVQLAGTNASYVIRPSTFLMPHKSPGPGLFILPCSQFDAVQNNFVLVLRMGTYTDYLRLTNLDDYFSLNPVAPRVPPTLCSLVTTTVQEATFTAIYDWTNDLANPFVSRIPSLFRDSNGISYLGGSRQFWLQQTFDDTSPYMDYENLANKRQTIGVWGSNLAQFLGGCCYNGPVDTPAWFRNYTMSLILFPKLAAPTVSTTAIHMLVSWDRTWDHDVSYYNLEQQVSGASTWFVIGDHLPTNSPQPFQVASTVPGVAYSFRVVVVNEGDNGAPTFSSTSTASAPIFAPNGDASSTGGAESSTGGGGESSTGDNGPTSPTVVVASPANYASAPPLNGLAGVDIVLREAMPGGATGPDTIWYTMAPSDQTPDDPVCTGTNTVGTPSSGGLATFTIHQSVRVKAKACASDGSGFEVAPLVAFHIVVKAVAPRTVPVYQEGNPSSAILTHIVTNADPFSFTFATDTSAAVNTPYFAYALSKFSSPVCGTTVEPPPTITVTQNQDVVAVTCQRGSQPSEVLHLLASMKVAPVTFTLNPADGQDRGAGVTVTFASLTPGVRFWYTTDGTAPQCNAPSNSPANDQIAVTSPTSFQVVGCKPGFTKSDVTHVPAAWKVADPVITVLAGNSTGLLGRANVSITLATLGATLWYTLDGTDPTCESGSASVLPPDPPVVGVSTFFVIFSNTTIKALGCKTIPPLPSFQSNVVTRVVVPVGGIDDDGDGVAQDVDACPNSLDVGKNVILDGCDSGVPNMLVPPYVRRKNHGEGEGEHEGHGGHGEGEGESHDRNAAYRFNRNVVGCNFRDFLEKCLVLARQKLTGTALKTLKGRNAEKAQDDFRACAYFQVDVWEKTQKLIKPKQSGSIRTCVRRVRFDVHDNDGEGESSSSSSHGSHGSHHGESHSEGESHKKGNKKK